MPLPRALEHPLRHTYAFRLADDGATNAIMALLGHASINTSQDYIDSTVGEQRRSAAANRTYRVLGPILTNSAAAVTARSRGEQMAEAPPN